MKTRVRMTVAAVASIASSAGMASASFDALWLGRFDGLSNSVHIVSAVPGVTGDYNAGHMQFQYTDVGGERGTGQFSGGTFLTFCIELQHTSNANQTYQVDSLANAPDPSPGVGGDQYNAADAFQVRQVLAAAIGLQWINADLTSGVNATNARMAAIQGHIWRVLFDDATVTANANIASEWTALLNTINANTYSVSLIRGLRGMLNAGSQDQLFIVPLPTAAFAGLMTLGGIAGCSRIRRR